MEDGPFAPNAQKMFSIIANDTDPDSIIIFFKPRVMKLLTGRQSLMINKVEQLSRGDYLCLNLRRDKYHQVSRFDAGRLAAKKSLRLVYHNNDFTVYQIIKQENAQSENTPGILTN